jgi:4-amino-4-deoxy-L-arabinose transferase-like glycosyltransferase
MNLAPGETEQFWHQCTLIMILVIAACARFYSLDLLSLSADGLQNLSYCGIEDWWDMAVANHTHSGMTPLYPTLMCQVTAWANNNEFFARAPSALAGLAAIYFIYLTGRDFISPTAGLLAAAIMATEFQAIDLSQDATLYSLLALLCLVHNYCFCQLFFSTNCYQNHPLSISRHGDKRDFHFSWRPAFPADACCMLGFWVSGALAFYTSPMALIQLLSEVLASAFLIKRAAGIFPQWRLAMRSLWLPLFIVILPWLPIFYEYRGWIMDGHLFAFQNLGTLWGHIQEVLPINPALLNICIALTVLCVLFMTAFRLLKNRYPTNFPLISFMLFQFGIATVSLWLVLPASPLSYFYYWWMFILLIQIPVAFGIDSTPPAYRKAIVAIAVTLILVLQIKSNAYYHLYDKEKGGDFRLAAQIIHDDQEFMKTCRDIVMSSSLFEYYLEKNDIKLSNFTVLDAGTALNTRDTSTDHSVFYYLEYAPYDKNLQNETAAVQAFTNQYKKVCMTTLPWIQVIKFSRDVSIANNEPIDCRTYLSGVVALK